MVGAGLTWLISLVGGGGPPSARAVAAGGIVGLLCCVFCYVPLELVSGRLQPMPYLARQIARAAVLVLGGVTGWMVANWVTQAALGVAFSTSSRSLVVIVSLTVGAIFITYDQLTSRLRASIEQLKRREVERAELELAGEIQRRLLPPTLVTGDGYRVIARHRPARVVAGDFYDVFRLGDASLAVVVADVVGKGMGASLIMATVKAMIPLLAADRSITDTTRELNRRLHRELGRREFVALAFIRLDPRTGRVELVNAGLPDPYLRQPDGAVSTVAACGPRLPVGVRAEVEYEATAIELRPGQRLVILTDGIPETRTAGGDLLGYDGLTRLLARPGEETETWLDELLGQVEARTSGDADDDWTVVVVEVREGR
jgi:hypothetical protein